MNVDGKFNVIWRIQKKMSSNYKNELLMYEGALKTTREYPRAIEIVSTDCNKLSETKAWLYTEKGNKTGQSVTARSETVPAAVEKWK